jgi:hypothetical protein
LFYTHTYTRICTAAFLEKKTDYAAETGRGDDTHGLAWGGREREKERKNFRGMRDMRPPPVS